MSAPTAPRWEGAARSSPGHRVGFARRVITSAPVLAGTVAGLFFIVQTWPWLVHLGTYGIAVPGDGLGGTSLWQAMVHEHLNPFAPGRIAAFNAPTGMPVTWQVDIQQWPTTLIMYSLTWATGGNGEFAYTAYVAAGVVLTAAAMAWLAQRLTKDRWASIVMGAALPLLPFMELARTGHPAFVHDWTIAATAGAIWALYERPSWKRAVAVGTLVFIAMSWSGYHLLFVVFTATLLMAGFFIEGWRTSRRWLHARDFMVVSGAMVFGIAIQYLSILFIGGGADPATKLRSFANNALTIFGARWYEYVIPDSRSIIFGGQTRAFFTSHLHGSNPSEATLYIGLSVGLLVICGLVAFWRGTLSRGALAPFLVCGALLFVGGTWASLPLGLGDHLLHIQVPTLAGLTSHISTNWRVFSRFVVVAAVGWFLLGAVGLSWLAGSGVRRVVVIAAAAAAIALDLYVPKASTSLEVKPPQIAGAIHRLPPGAMAEYPLVRGEVDGYGPLFNEQWYGRPVMNGFDDQPQEATDDQLVDLSQASTVESLALLKIRYVLRVDRPLAGVPSGTVSHLLHPLFSGTYGPWPATVFEVPAPVKDVVVVTGGRGFSSPEHYGSSSWQWLTSESGLISLVARCIDHCMGTLEMGIAAFGSPRHVTLRANDGKRMAEFVVGTPRVVKLPLELRGRATSVQITARPGPLPVASVIRGSPDPRSLSIQIINARWIDRAVESTPTRAHRRARANNASQRR